MCGRYALTADARKLARHFLLDESALGALGALQPRYNIAPTQNAPVVRAAATGDAARPGPAPGAPAGPRTLALLRWGLVPPWADDPAIGDRMINARAETAAQKPAFRQAMRRRRCLVPADGFFEWQAVAGRKQPMFITLAEGGPLALAGLWERWTPKGPDERDAAADAAGADAAPPAAVESFTILTTDANELLRPVHPRMPVIVAPGDYGLWLGERPADESALAGLLRPFPPDRMAMYPVTPRVGNPRFDHPDCLKRIA